ncbi:C40 family peptidase [Clostridium gasigenes]|uniref:C40 family peptidase n=1 Tax=Clostridium gasigenes TaxID=94869 RepID=UPI001C0C997E|nr:C40 family peptidase [Clostridium gasigenes]MBU3131855.1 C40 family peptidase [Clostridium gasigenes]
MGTRSRGKAFISTAIIVVIILNTSMSVLATPNEEVIENQKKYTVLTETIDKTQGEVYRLNTEIEKLTEVIKKNVEELKVISNEVEVSKKEMKYREDEIKKQEDMLGKRIRELYKSGGQNNLILVLLKSEGITDLISKVYTVGKIVDLDKKIVNELNDNQEKLEKSVKESEKKISDSASVTESNKKALEELENKKKEQVLLISKILLEKSKFDTEYLAVSEIKIIEPQLKILKESNSLEELHGAIVQLINIRDKQLKSLNSIEQINKSIIEVTKRVSGLEQYLKDKGTNLNSGVLSGSLIVSYAYQFLGKPYVVAGNGPDEFDCSGFTRYVYNNTVGIDITRTTYTQIKQGKSISLSELQLGDLVFMYGVDHVGIYVGGGCYIHAPQPGETIKVSQITSFTEGRRISFN